MFKLKVYELEDGDKVLVYKGHPALQYCPSAPVNFPPIPGSLTSYDYVVYRNPTLNVAVLNRCAESLRDIIARYVHTEVVYRRFEYMVVGGKLCRLTPLCVYSNVPAHETAFWISQVEAPEKEAFYLPTLPGELCVQQSTLSLDEGAVRYEDTRLRARQHILDVTDEGPYRVLHCDLVWEEVDEDAEEDFRHSWLWRYGHLGYNFIIRSRYPDFPDSSD